jgi:Tol biopolymer transport system component
MRTRLLAIFLLLLPFSVQAIGTFGLNKVQYEPFDWKLVRTSHFDLYYYQGADSLAAFTAREVEKEYDRSVEYLNHRLRQRIPIILHNTHAQFEQTNVIRFPIPEAVGGFTEVFKNRIVLPFDGSYTSFRHVLQHEMLHAMVFDLVSNGRRGYNTAAKLGDMPLWISEGSSEYGSLGWDLGSEFVMLDAVTNGYVTNPAEDLYGYMAYKGGQNFLYYVESVWGKGTTAKIFQSLSDGIPFPTAFLRSTRVTLEEAGEIWLRECRRIYWPELGRRQYAKNIARAMTDHRKDESFYNVNPALSPDGKRIAFFSDRGNWEAVYILDTETEKITRTALEGGSRAAHESFHSFTSALAWAPDSRHILLVSKQGGRDVLHIIDGEKSKVVSTINPSGLEAVSSPALSPDGKSIVVSGQKASIQDLYLLQLPSAVGGKGFPQDLSLDPIALTSGRASEERPTFSPSGLFVAFQSNRDQDLKDAPCQDKLDVFLLKLSDKSVQKVSPSRWSSHSPTFGEDDSLLIFISNRSGVDNMYMQQTFGDSLWPISNLLSSVTSPSWSRTGSSLAFSLFENGGWDVFLLKDPWKARMHSPLPRTRFIEVAEDTTGTQKMFENIAFENLKTYKSQRAMDSLEAKLQEAIRRPDPAKKSSEPEDIAPVGEEDGFFNPEESPSPAKPDTLKPASSKKDTTHQDSTHKNLAHGSDSAQVDSSKMAGVSEIAPGWDPPDTSKIFLPRGDSIPFLPSGALRAGPYKTQWTLDQAEAVAGFSSMSGVGGQGALTFSDLMGDQELNLWFFGAGSLDNLNIFVSYGYLPNRMDWSVSGFHNYREGSEDMLAGDYFAKHDSILPAGYENSWVGIPYGDRSLGGSLSLTYPFSLYSRVDLSSLLTWRTRKWYVITDAEYDGFQWNYNLAEDSLMAPESMNTMELALSWSFDNAQWGISGPVEGQRLWLGVQGIPPEVLQDKIAYWRADMDFRKYFRVFQRYTFAFRVAGGFSEAIGDYQNPQRYLLGGDDWTINWHFNEKNWHGTQEDIFFSSWETPLRGFRYHDFEGTRMGIFNAEFRYPLIDRLQIAWPIPIQITNVTGVLFTDFGGTWEDRDVLENRGMGYGWGWRLNLGVFVLRYTKAWSTAEWSTVKRGEYTYWSLGAEF